LPRLRAPSTWVKLVEADRASQALSTIPYIISGKDPEYPTNTRVQKDMSNKSDIYRKHMQNNEIYMCLYKAIRFTSMVHVRLSPVMAPHCVEFRAL
ncbi:hypothetical protein B296_00035027, partial [Ensete ventricosum]